MSVTTHYGVQRRDGYWWAGSNYWSVTAAPARWFDSWTAAELSALRELPDSTRTWFVRQIPERAYSHPMPRPA